MWTPGTLPGVLRLVGARLLYSCGGTLGGDDSMADVSGSSPNAHIPGYVARWFSTRAEECRENTGRAAGGDPCLSPALGAAWNCSFC